MEFGMRYGRHTLTALATLLVVALALCAVPSASGDGSATDAAEPDEQYLEFTDEQYAEFIRNWGFEIGEYGLYEGSYFTTVCVSFDLAEGDVFGIAVYVDGEWLTIMEVAYEYANGTPGLVATLTEDGIALGRYDENNSAIAVSIVASNGTFNRGMSVADEPRSIFEANRGIPDYVKIGIAPYYGQEAVDVVGITGDAPDHYFEASSSLNVFWDDQTYVSIDYRNDTFEEPVIDQTVTLTAWDITFSPHPEGRPLVGYSAIPNSGIVDYQVGDRLTVSLGKVYMLFPVYDAGVTVTYVSEGEVHLTKSVRTGTVLNPIAEPERDGYSFTGWYLDEGCTQPYDQTAAVDADLTLYAGWSDGNTGPHTPGHAHGPEDGSGDESGDGSGGITGGTEDTGSDGADSTEEPEDRALWPWLLLILIIVVIVIAALILR